MKRKILTTILLGAACFFSEAKAQVNDVSVTLSPFAEYNWWNKDIALQNTPFYGARVGFGFGPFFELRGTFEKSINLKNALQGKSWNPLSPGTLDKLNGMDIDITRIGGDAKINILGKFGLSPYLTAGAGVQIFDYNPFSGNAIDNAKVKEKQIYMSWGAGIKLGLTHRAALSLEARNLYFGMDENNSYFDPAATNKDRQLSNWIVAASLDFYLGGNSSARADQYGRAYRNIFSDGFKGPKFVAEPGVAYLDFSNKVPHADQWFVGGSAGIDLSSLIGFRGFYYQATKDPNKLAWSFNNNLRMYGLNAITRLNYPRGIVPYLSLGLGYLDVRDGVEVPTFKKNNLFAMAGAGIEVPVSKYIALFGTYNAMVMTNRQVINSLTQLKSPSETIVNNMYTAGVRINIGASATAPVYEAVAFAPKATEADNARINELRLDKALTPNAKVATAKVATTAPQQEVAKGEKTQESVFDNLFSTQRDFEAKMKKEEAKNERLTKKEFEELVDRIVEKIRKEETQRTAILTQDETALLLAALNNGQRVAVAPALVAPATAQAAPQVAPTDTSKSKSDVAILAAALKEISDKLDRNHADMLKQKSEEAAVAPAPTPTVAPAAPVVTPAAPTTVAPAQAAPAAAVVTTLPTSPVDEIIYAEASPATARSNGFYLNRLAIYTGPSLGETAQWNIGFRGYMQISKTALDFMPEVYIGLGKSTGYGLSANVIYNFNLRNIPTITPYVGIGLGLYNYGAGVKTGMNVIAGLNFNMISNGSFFIDFSARNTAKYSQVAAGYRFIF